jgi:hypothetical protein
MSEDNGTDYPVGYKKPPVHGRFQKGRSGNGNGRPKGAVNLATRTMKELNQIITITENGVRKQVTKLDAAVKQLANKAAGGDLKAITKVTEILAFAEGRETVETPINKEDEKKILLGIQARMVKSQKGRSDD